jgi:S-adenosylmethionine hydrolase
VAAPAREGDPIIALLTDFGTGSVYVGAMKGVIASCAPRARAIDLTHEVAPQAVAEGSFLLAGAWRLFPEGTVFCAVVDPGVGSDRAVVCLEACERLILAPDNGLLSGVLEALEREGAPSRARRVENAALFLPEVSATFHGRDIFAPVAARLASGEAAPAALGHALDPASLVRLARPGREDPEDPRALLGHIVHIDRFGNLVTDLAPPRKGCRPKGLRLHGREVVRAARTYAEAPPGEPFVTLGSFGTVEVALREESAAAALGVRPGTAVRVFFEESEPSP